MAATYISIIIFIGVMLYLGYIGMKRTKNVNDFFLAGRNIGPWLSAFTYGTTYFSAVIFVGFAGKLGWSFGLNALWIAGGNVILGVLLAWLVLAKRTRQMTSHLNAMTMPEFLEARYKSKGIKVLAAFCTFFFLIIYSASVYQGLGFLFRENLGLSFEMCLFFIAILTGVYLVMGGYHAINIADMVQGLIMMVGAILMVLFLTGSLGGFKQSVELQRERYWEHFAKPGVEKKVEVESPSPEAAEEAIKDAGTPEKAAKPAPPWWILFSLVILTSLGPWGLPQMVQKYYAIKNSKIIPRAIVVCTVFAIIISFVAYFSGSLTHVFFEPGREVTIETGKGQLEVMSLPMKDKSPEFDAFIPTMLQKHTPGWLNIAILLLILSASMSTLSGLVLVSSSALAIDLYQGKNPTEVRRQNALFFMRILCALFVGASVFVALLNITIIVNLMSIAWGGLAGCFLAPYLYGLFWKRGTTTAVWVSMISALTITLVGFAVWGKGMAPVYGTVSMLAPLLIMPLVSILTKPLPKEEIDQIFEFDRNQ